jgi:hypothetical protein
MAHKVDFVSSSIPSARVVSRTSSLILIAPLVVAPEAGELPEHGERLDAERDWHARAGFEHSLQPSLSFVELTAGESGDSVDMARLLSSPDE